MLFAQRMLRCGKISSSRIIAFCLSRFLAILVFVPSFQTNFFVPFLSTTVSQLFDPWSLWLNSGGRLDAFPYGPVMYALLLPSVGVAHLISSITTLQFISVAQITLATTLLLLDYLLCRALAVFERGTSRSWAWAAILSPVPFYINYLEGQLDVIPAVLLLLSVNQISKGKWRRSGFWLGLGISAKFSLILVLPFLFVYFFSTGKKLEPLKNFLTGLIPSLIIGILPILWSNGFIRMVLKLPSTFNGLFLGIRIDTYSLLLLPVIYSLLFLWFWNLNRVNPLVLTGFIGAVLLSTSIFQTTSIGWIYWGWPVLMVLARKSSLRTIALLVIWQFVEVFFYLTRDGKFDFRIIGQYSLSQISRNISDMSFTMSLVFGIAVVIKMLLESLRFGDIFGISRRPISISISGDSGVGKDSLTMALSTCFGVDNSSVLLGDDFHLYERGDITWRSLTHLNPAANDLDSLNRNFKKFLKRESVLARHYDHKLGRFTLPRELKPNDLVILNGLHSQLISDSASLDLKIFLSMDEELRVHLKLNRDLKLRGYSEEATVLESIKIRKNDYNKYVAPQSEKADLVFHVAPLSLNPLRTEIHITSPNDSFLRTLHSHLSTLTTNEVFLDTVDGKLLLKINAMNFESADAEAVIRSLLPSAEQLFVDHVVFERGDLGFMSMVALLFVGRKRLHEN